MNRAAIVARRFAEALDQEDYDAAAGLLDGDCEYSCRGQRFRGPDAIVESYRQSGDTAAKTFDRVVYESAITPVSERLVLIHFTDRLFHRDHRFTFECQQRVEVNQAGRIVRIEHEDLAGQPEALQQFMQQIGAERL